MTKCEQVAARIARLIESETLRSGERIPSIRAMAEQMNLSIMTVLEGYRRLEDRGLVECRPQAGYFVKPELLRDRPREISISVPECQEIRLDSRSVRTSELTRRLLELLWRPGLIPLGVGFSSPEFFPTESLSRHLARVSRGDPHANQYEVGLGYPALRHELARKMMDCGCDLAPDEILVTLGGTEALHIALNTVLKPGDEVAVESPGYFGFFSMLERLRLRAVEIPSDPQHGLSVTALKTVLARNRRIGAVLLCPALSNPTGATMPEAAKDELIGLCRRARVTIIEDDTFGDLVFAGHRSSSLKSRDPERVVFIGSLSKVLSPGYRIGWVAGGCHHDELFRSHANTILCAPTPTQMAVASFLAGGGFQRHLRKLRRAFAENVARFRQEVSRHFPGHTRITNSNGGHFLWVELPAPCDSTELAFRCAKEGFSIAPGVLFSARDHYRRFLRLNAGLSWTEDVRSALRRLGEMAKEQSRLDQR